MSILFLITNYLIWNTTQYSFMYWKSCTFTLYIYQNRLFYTILNLSFINSKIIFINRTSRRWSHGTSESETRNVHDVPYREFMPSVWQVIVPVLCWQFWHFVFVKLYIEGIFILPFTIFFLSLNSII